jgi:hypothetical protein
MAESKCIAHLSSVIQAQQMTLVSIKNYNALCTSQSVIQNGGVSFRIRGAKVNFEVALKI